VITSAIDRFRDEPGKGMAAIFGVLLIVGLLWAIGHVVQGQVLQAQARDNGQLQAQAMALRCSSQGAAHALSACADNPAWPAANDASGAGLATGTGQPVYVSYR
jgi:amino acid transporter